jgi:hypothetical protein
MPFQYQFPVPVLPDAGLTIIFRRWLIEEQGCVSRGTAVAVIESSGRLYRVLANGEGLLWKKFVAPGDQVKSTATLGMIAADGENVPYGRPYSVAELEEGPA